MSAQAFEELLKRCPRLKEWLDERGLMPENARWLQKGGRCFSEDVVTRLRVVHEEMYDVKVEWFECGVAIHAWHVDGYWDMVVVIDERGRIFAWEWE